jgi:hypothetical protein
MLKCYIARVMWDMYIGCILTGHSILDQGTLLQLL